MILLTGASGYLGRHVEKLLTPFGCWSVGGPDAPRGCDLTRPEQAIKLIVELRPSLVLHCAAIVPKSADGYHDKLGAVFSVKMLKYIKRNAACRVVFASTMSIHADTAYAAGKREAEGLLGRQDVILRLPGLFGQPRTSGVIYDAALTGEIPESFGPYPAMHVADAAEYLVRAATMPSDGKPEPFSVTYGDPRLERVYGSLGVTFAQRVQEFAAQLKVERVSA